MEKAFQLETVERNKKFLKREMMDSILFQADLAHLPHQWTVKGNHVREA